MLRSRRLPRKAAIAVLALAVLAGLPHGGRQPAHQTAAGQRGGTVAAVTLSATMPDGGPCSVPGIGDIGGLLGFCSLGSSGLVGSLNNLCDPGVPEPESAVTGVDALISPPPAPGKPIATPYNEYGMAGQDWAATNLQCSDMTSLIGNDVAGMLFDFAKALDRVTITVYQSAAGEGILGWLQNVTDKLITGLGNAIYFPYVALVVIIGAIWLAWQGLIRKRATKSIEGTIWMVVACAAAIWLIGRPADFTGLGKGVSDGISTTLNTAFAHLPSPGQPDCLPVTGRDPQISQASFSYSSGRTVVDQNANELWTVLVCKPWLDGEFGTTAYTQNGHPTPVAAFGRQLLWAQAIAVNEKPTSTLISAKQAAYTGIAQTIQNKDPAIYPLFQGKEWTTRLEIAFAALLAAIVAGVLILLISVTLILLKLGFLLLLIVGPFFLLIGTHPGFGRVVAIRWFEMLVGVLLKQAAVALALSVLLYCYALIMGTSDQVLPWALKILMITLVTVAVFIYRKPFQHLFAGVGYGAIGSTARAEADLSRAAATARANTRDAATLAVPGLAAYRAARWARRNPAQAAGLALGAGAVLASSGAAAGAAAGAMTGSGAGGDGAGGSEYNGGSPDPAGTGVAAGAGAGARARAWSASAGSASASEAPPLRLPADHSAPVSWAKSGTSSGPWSASAGGASSAAAPAPSGGSSAPPPRVRPSARPSAGQGAPPAWAVRGGPRPPRPSRAPGAGERRPEPTGRTRATGSVRPDAAQSGRAAPAAAGAEAKRPLPPKGTRPAPPAGLLGQGRPSRQDRTARPARPPRPSGGSGEVPRPDGGGSGVQGDFPPAPYGLRPRGDEDRSGPFWSRPIWRRK